MATKVKAYPKGSTEAIEWVVDNETDPAELGATLANAGRGDSVSIPTSAGWIIVEPQAFGAFEVLI